MLSTSGADAVRYYEYDRSRAGAVATRLIGRDYQGHLVSDFYAASNQVPGPHQRCWGPLLRELEHA